MTTSWLTSHTRRARRGPAFIIVVLAALACAAPGRAASATYSWPVKPFDVQHPVRAFFGDPRIGPGAHGELVHNFHFGIDIHARDGVAVYATIDGVVSFNARHSDVVIVTGSDGTTIHEYWHVSPTVRAGQRVAARHTIVGRVSCCDHVHFAERHGAQYVNPLRAGGLGPYRDRTRPFVRSLTIQRGDRPISPARISGDVDLVVEAYDPTPTALPEPWTGNPVTPARVSWRLLLHGRQVTHWLTAVDFGRVAPPNTAYSSVYARWTRQNKKAHEGRYRFVLAHGWDSRSIRDGSYEVEVAASDTKGNTGTARFPITVLNRV